MKEAWKCIWIIISTWGWMLLGFNFIDSKAGTKYLGRKEVLFLSFIWSFSKTPINWKEYEAVQKPGKFCCLEKWVILIGCRHWLVKVVTLNCCSSGPARRGVAIQEQRDCIGIKWSPPSASSWNSSGFWEF